MQTKEKITKEYAIAKFKNLVSTYRNGIEENIGTNTHRRYWELNLNEIVLAIEHDKENEYHLFVWDAHGSIYLNNRNMNMIGKFKLSDSEYADLKKHYFGEFTVDGYYAKAMARLTKQQEYIKELDLNYP